jgi:integrase
VPSGGVAARVALAGQQDHTRPAEIARRSEDSRHPAVIIPALREYLAVFVAPGADSLVFPGAKGAPLRRSNFNRASGWPRAAQATGVPGVHFHDLRHTGTGARSVTWAYVSERATGIEPAWPAWKAGDILRPTAPARACDQEI